ncbi:MAG: hypothetical protein V1898_01435 [Patescibacteria group bacterium]
MNERIWAEPLPSGPRPPEKTMDGEIGNSGLETMRGGLSHLVELARAGKRHIIPAILATFLAEKVVFSSDANAEDPTTPVFEVTDTNFPEVLRGLDLRANVERGVSQEFVQAETKRLPNEAELREAAQQFILKIRSYINAHPGSYVFATVEGIASGRSRAAETADYAGRSAAEFEDYSHNMELAGDRANAGLLMLREELEKSENADVIKAIMFYFAQAMESDKMYPVGSMPHGEHHRGVQFSADGFAIDLDEKPLREILQYLSKKAEELPTGLVDVQPRLPGDPWQTLMELSGGSRLSLGDYNQDGLPEVTDFFDGHGTFDAGLRWNPHTSGSVLENSRFVGSGGVQADLTGKVPDVNGGILNELNLQSYIGAWGRAGVILGQRGKDWHHPGEVQGTELSAQIDWGTIHTESKTSPDQRISVGPHVAVPLRFMSSEHWDTALTVMPQWVLRTGYDGYESNQVDFKFGLQVHRKGGSQLGKMERYAVEMKRPETS